jgi:hypothetical protein
MQRRATEAFELDAAAAFRGQQSAHLKVGESVRSGITSYGVRLPAIPIPNDPFGIRLYFRGERPANVHLIAGFVLPNENMSYEYRYTVKLDAADGWRQFDTGVEFFLIKQRVVESF